MEAKTIVLSHNYKCIILFQNLVNRIHIYIYIKKMKIRFKQDLFQECNVSEHQEMLQCNSLL